MKTGWDTSRCQLCYQRKETKLVSIGQNVGLLIARRYSKVEGRLCKSCISEKFWSMTGTTLVLGWWGVISFLMTPFILIGNIYTYISSLSMSDALIREPTSRSERVQPLKLQESARKYGDQLRQARRIESTRDQDRDVFCRYCGVHYYSHRRSCPACGAPPKRREKAKPITGIHSQKKPSITPTKRNQIRSTSQRISQVHAQDRPFPRGLIIAGIVSVIIIFITAIILGSEYLASNESKAAIEPAQVVLPTIKPTSTSRPTVSDKAQSPASVIKTSEPECRLWSTISLSDVGRNYCIYGNVYSVFETEQAFFVTFSSNTGAFYILSYDWIFPEIKPGACVMGEGEISRLGSSPVMVVEYHDSLYHCR